MVLLPQAKDDLAHMVVGYDPVKAHEYYLRTRKLHPRQKGQQAVTGLRSRASSQPAGKNQVLAKQRAEAAAAVTQLSKKLTELKGVLAIKKAALSRDKKLKPTASDKSKKARESKKYRQKHKQELKTKAKKARGKGGGGGSKKVIDNPKSGSIKEVEAAIKTVTAALNTAKARQRALG